MSEANEQVVPCWKGRAEYIEEIYGYLSDEDIDNCVLERQMSERGECGSATCMLPEGHDGPHVFTPDDQIVVKFA